MRMWLANPKIMCRAHLLGEHVEMHMFAGSIRKGVSIKGYVAGGLVDTRVLQTRHDHLAAELVRRGYNHASPLDYHDVLKTGSVNRNKSLAELLSRCKECSKRAVMS